MDDFKNHKDKIRPLLIKHTKIRPEYFDFIYQKNLDVFSPDGSLGEADVRIGYLDARKGAVNAPPVEMSTVFDLGPLREVEGK
jgi:hypothetical protein